MSEEEFMDDADFPDEFKDLADQPDEEPTVLDEYALVCYLTSCPNAWALARPILKPGYFDNEFRKIIEFCIKFSDKYKKLPSKLIIRGETGIKLETPDDADDPRIFDWLIDEVESHCRYKATVELILANSEVVGNGKRVTRADTAAINEQWKAVSLLSMGSNLGVEVHHGMKDALFRAKENSGISCGLKHLDQILDGGFSRKSLNLFVAGSGVGKSVMMSNFAFSYAKIHKYNVVYVTLELDEDLTQKRFASIMTGVSTTEVYQHANDIDRELLLRMKGERKEGNIYLKKMSMNGTTNADIRAYIHDLMIKTGLVFDVLVVDYLDLMSPQTLGIDPNNLHLKDKHCTEELRGTCEDLNLIGFSASQRTKGSEDDSEQDSQGHVSGGTGRVNTVDNLIFARRSDRDREEGRMWLTSKKSRTSTAHGKRIPVKWDNNNLIISDATDEEFAAALPYLTGKDLSKSSPIQKKYSHLVPQKNGGVNTTPAGSKAIDKFLRGRRAGT
jgi:hypothetical protein